MPSHLSKLALAILLGSVPASPVSAQQGSPPVQPDRPGVGGDAELPAGYKTLRWGINDVAMQHVLGRGLEKAPGMDSHRHFLIDTPSADQQGQRGVVKFHFWDSRLFEVTMYYNLSASDGKALLARFQEKYGAAKHDVVRNKIVEYGAKEANVQEERWQWKDPFTLQILRRELDGEKWSMVRQSRVLEERRLAQQRKEREAKRSSKVGEIELD